VENAIKIETTVLNVNDKSEVLTFKTKKKWYNNNKIFIKNKSFLVKGLEFNLPANWVS
jgi:hypothetical protein